MKSTIIFIAALLAAVAASAQNYEINWHKIAGGGGTSTGTNSGAGGTVYSVSGTIGQHDASSSMTGGAYSLTGGFWALYAIQSLGAPTLYITGSNGQVIVSWLAVSGWTLQQNGNLSNSGGWAASGGTINTTNGINYVVIQPPVGDMYLRLKQ